MNTLRALLTGHLTPEQAAEADSAILGLVLCGVLCAWIVKVLS